MSSSQGGSGVDPWGMAEANFDETGRLAGHDPERESEHAHWHFGWSEKSEVTCGARSTLTRKQSGENRRRRGEGG